MAAQEGETAVGSSSDALDADGEPEPSHPGVGKRRLSQVAATLPDVSPEVAAVQRAEISAIQSRSSSFRGFTEDELDVLFPLLSIIEVCVIFLR